MSYLPTSASFLLTEDCNLACTYCFEKHNKNKMSLDVVHAGVDFLANNAMRNGNDRFNALLFGGEPFMNLDAAEELLRYGWEESQKRQIKFTASVVTNGTIMNNRLAKIIEEYRDKVNLGIQLSVDGVKKVHDMYRITKEGKPSFDIIEKNIPKFQALYNGPDDRRLSIHGCVNKDSLPYLYESWCYFRYVLNFKQIWFLLVPEERWEFSDIKLYRAQCEKIYKEVTDEFKRSEDRADTYNYSPFDKYECVNQRNSKPCGAGESFVTITAKGDIYPCHEIYFNDDYNETCFGNVFDKRLDEDVRRIWVDYEESDLGCEPCENKQCYRCLAANWTHNGGMFNQIKGFHCAFAAIDREFQLKLRDEVNKYFNDVGEVQQKVTDCLCNCREGIAKQGCDVVLNQNNCQSGENPENPDCLGNVRRAGENGN